MYAIPSNTALEWFAAYSLGFSLSIPSASRPRFHQHPAVQQLLGSWMAGYLRFVHWTCRVTVLPSDFDTQVREQWPVIVALWHGQHIMVPFARPKWADVHVMIALHADAEANAIAVQKLGMGVIRGSGAQHKHDIARKKGAAGLLQLLRLLKNNISVALTADVPKGPDKIAGAGIVTLARMSGRPIVPIAVANQHRWAVNSWDRAAIPLPFGRMCIVLDTPIWVPPDLDAAALDDYRVKVKEALDRAHRVAYEAVDGRSGTFSTRAHAPGEIF